MTGGGGPTGGLTNPRPWRGRCQASDPNTSGPPWPGKRAPSSRRKPKNLLFLYFLKNKRERKSGCQNIIKYIFSKNRLATKNVF